MASGENVLWIVIKRLNFGSRTVWKADKYFVFRTKKAANEFRKAKNLKSRDYNYMLPQRATWGPEQ